MAVKRSMVGGQAPAYENRLDRDPKSVTFGKKLHYPLHLDGSPSHEGYVRAGDALRAHQLMVTKAQELAHTEGYSAHDEGLDILSNPYTGELGRAWGEGWKRADSDYTEEVAIEDLGRAADEQAELDRDLLGDVNPLADEAQV